MAWSTIYPATDQNIAAAPASHGVYALYSGGPLIYIGRAYGAGVTIRSRLQAHKRGDEGSCTKAMTDFAYMATTAPQSAESDALAAYKRENGRLPRCNEQMP